MFPATMAPMKRRKGGNNINDAGRDCERQEILFQNVFDMTTSLLNLHLK